LKKKRDLRKKPGRRLRQFRLLTSQSSLGLTSKGSRKTKVGEEKNAGENHRGHAAKDKGKVAISGLKAKMREGKKIGPRDQ